MIHNINNSEHYQWGGGRCDGWRLVDGEEVSLIQERVPPGASETRHVHRQAAQIFFILDGEAVMELEGEEHALHAGDSLLIPPGKPHQFMNRSAAEVHFLVFSSPPSRTDRIEMAAYPGIP